MLYIGIPSYNEATTIGVLLWRLRSVLADVSREYEVVVYDDASTDQTAETLAPYTRVLPLTVLRGAKRVGYGGAVDAIARHVAKTTRYPRRDALLLLQGDFTDPPALVPEFLRRFEGGADLILGERTLPDDTPQPVHRLYRAARWVLRPFVGITDVRDLTSSYRLVRIAVLRDLIKASADAPISAGDFWDANVDFALRAAALARRVETIPVTPTFQVRTRESRRTAWPDAIALAKWAWRRRGDRVAVRVIARTAEVAEPVSEEPLIAEPTERAGSERRERAGRPERSARPERKSRRERSGRSSTDDGAAPRQRAAGGRRTRRDAVADGTRSDESGNERAEDAPAGSGAAAGAQGGSGDASVGEEARTRRARPRRRRGGRKDRPSDEGRDETTRDEPAASASAAGEADDSGRPAPRNPAGGSGTADAVAESGGDARSDSQSRGDGDDETEADTATPRKRRRSRRGRRKRPDGEAPGAEGMSGDEGDASAARSRGGGSRQGREAESSESTRDGGTPDDSDSSESAEAPRRRRSRRGRRGGARRRDGQADAGEGQASGDAQPSSNGPRTGGGAAPDAPPTGPGLRSEPGPRSEAD